MQLKILESIPSAFQQKVAEIYAGTITPRSHRADDIHQYAVRALTTIGAEHRRLRNGLKVIESPRDKVVIENNEGKQ